MKKFIPVLILLFLSTQTGAQLISRFTWETNPLTASYGPNALSVSSYATVSQGGKNETKGLNPGGQYDINLVLDGSYFNVPAIDISVDFRREESVASLFYRGTYFNLGMTNGSLSVTFLLASGTTYTTVNSGNIYTVPDDHIFHNYRFYYDNNTGTAKILVDAAIVYTYTGAAGIPLYWTGAGNVTIGKDMDGTGKNIPVLDNLVIQKYTGALLPLKLLSFTAEAKNKFAVIDWSTTEETGVSSFIVEKSFTGSVFSAAKTIAASNRYSTTNHYQFTDSIPFSPVTYYRLKMLNGDGSFTYSEIKAVSVTAVVKNEIAVYPNPVTDYVIIKMNNTAAGKYLYTVSTITGQPFTASTVQLSSGLQQVKIDLNNTSLHGVIIIKISNTQTGATDTFTLIKK